ncbi:UNVERIFIED_CONTAM: Cell division cycle protein [Sesamum radiatum]|uniref:Cell division cycle protein n=1 Tax=Sesamum radiatum TaxID=300843 RepID=A0AAW2TGL4_SESRA
MKEEDINRCQIQQWYPNFESCSIKTTIHELPESFVQYLLDDSGPFLLPLSITNDDALPNRVHKPEEEEDFVAVEGSGDEAEEPVPPPSFPELEMEIKASIGFLGGAVFPKLNWSAPKDSAWISSTGNLKCTSFSEIALLLRSSDSVIFAMHMIHAQIRLHQGHQVSSLHSVNGGEFWSYTFDVYVTKDGRVKLLDFNPWGASTLPLIFTWDELEEKLREEGNELEFRTVESQCGIRPGLKTAVPYDYLDTSQGSGWDQFLRNVDEELRRQTSAGA